MAYEKDDLVAKLEFIIEELKAARDGLRTDLERWEHEGKIEKNEQLLQGARAVASLRGVTPRVVYGRDGVRLYDKTGRIL